MYKDYLNSEEWKERRNSQIQMDGCCRFCGKKEGLQVHHISYERIGDEIPGFDLITLCRGCHERLHEVIKKYKPKSEIAKREYQEAAKIATNEIYGHWVDSAGKILAEATMEIEVEPKRIVTAVRVIKEMLELGSNGCGPVRQCGGMPYEKAIAIITERRRREQKK